MLAYAVIRSLGGSLPVGVSKARSGRVVAAADVVTLAKDGKIKVAYAADEESLKSALPSTVELRDPTGALDIDKGWIWVKVPVDLDKFSTGPILWKVMIDR